MEDIKEKSADELFEELGYKKNRDNEKEILYKKEYKSETNFIAIDFDTKTILCEYSDEDYEFNGALNINMQELKAINKKVEELRMEIISEILIKILIYTVGLFIFGFYEYKKGYKKGYEDCKKKHEYLFSKWML